jgi:hypothetical protein
MINRKKSSLPRFTISRNLRFYVIVLVCIFVTTTFYYAGNYNPTRLRGASPSYRKFPVVTDVQYDHAIIVAGHAVMHVDDIAEAQVRDEAWNLLGYQRGQGFPQIISSHIAAGVAAAMDDSRSVLLFSGGQTRRDAGPTSEAVSYFYLAQQEHLIKDGLNVALEEYARDSFENVLFSICRFHEVTGNYPNRVTVVGFDFKGRRFQNIIRRAVQFPSDKFSYIGVKPDAPGFDYNKAVEGEAVVYESALNDMYGCGSLDLLKKKLTRDPFHRTIPYELACPDIKDLIKWCGPDTFKGHLPWQDA